MANQPDFRRLTESFHVAGDHFAMFENLTSIYGRQATQNRHDELIGLFGGVNTRLDHMETRLDRMDGRLDRMALFQSLIL